MDNKSKREKKIRYLRKESDEEYLEKKKKGEKRKTNEQRTSKNFMSQYNKPGKI